MCNVISALAATLQRSWCSSGYVRGFRCHSGDVRGSLCRVGREQLSLCRVRRVRESLTSPSQTFTSYRATRGLSCWLLLMCPRGWRERRGKSEAATDILNQSSTFIKFPCCNVLKLWSFLAPVWSEMFEESNLDYFKQLKINCWLLVS